MHICMAIASKPATILYLVIPCSAFRLTGHRRRNRGSQGARAPQIFGMSFFQNQLITSTVNNSNFFFFFWVPDPDIRPSHSPPPPRYPAYAVDLQTTTTPCESTISTCGSKNEQQQESRCRSTNTPCQDGVYRKTRNIRKLDEVHNKCRVDSYSLMPLLSYNSSLPGCRRTKSY